MTPRLSRSNNKILMFQVVVIVLLTISLAWLFLLSVLFWRMLVHYNKLIDGSGNKGLKSLLEQVLEDNYQNKKSIENIRAICAKIDKEGDFHIQKVGLLRFNPFKDTGGNQSFILSLVDKNNTGVIISGLYSRSGLRWYAKKVLNGKGVEHELSEDEEKALKEAGSTK